MMRGRSAAILIVAALAAANTSAAAPTKPTKPVAPAPAPALPAPAVTLTVTPGTGGGPWKLTIQNNGEVPVRLAADPRLLSLELTRAAGEKTAGEKKAKGEPATLKCVLPQDARPSTDEGSELVVPAKRSYSRAFDPLFYCFGARERAALVSGTSVRPRFGWSAHAPAKTAKAAPPSPPFAVSPVGAAVGQVSAVKEIEGAPFTLGEAVAITPAPTPSADGSSSSDATLSEGDIELTLPEATDAARGVDIGTTVTLTNRGSRALTLLFRPQTLLFTVNGPSGAVSCGSTHVIEAPIRELYSTVGAKAKAQQTLLLTAVCPPDTFDEPGIYRVLPRIDTSGASARKLGLSTWDGKASGKVPMLLRVRTPRRPSTQNKPALD